MGKIWDEKSIREVFEELDKSTGLSGAELPIYFGNAKGTLGCFIIKNGPAFRFSDYWFKDPEWPEESALDVIRHEYAHYMDWSLTGYTSHGSSWKTCCIRVGAVPSRLYSEGRSEYYKNKHKKEEDRLAHLNKYKTGQAIEHPQYGTGIITVLDKKERSIIARVDFGEKGVKTLDLNWIDCNCTIE